MDTTLRDVDVTRYRAVLTDAAESVACVQPPELREPLALWFRAEAQRAAAWTSPSLLGRSVVSCWNAARAVLDAWQAGTHVADETAVVHQCPPGRKASK
ncbi:MAG TPA: hypothetical protein VG497_10310 [Kribbella sp.]|nr:hypothetical protein [Kribbella sp.]